MSNLYIGDSKITGKLSKNTSVVFKSVLSKYERVMLFGHLSLIMTSCAAMLFILYKFTQFSGFNLGVVLLLSAVAVVEIIRVLQSLTLYVFAMKAQDPIPMQPGTGLRIAVLTTIVPGKEPWRIVAKTLRSMKRISPGKGNTLDVWLLDEGNDPKIKEACQLMGVKHFSRKGVAKWNEQSGEFRAKTKHGNHNSWRAAHEDSYDIVAQMDPDHVPFKNFLTRTLGYFTDPNVGFVVAPQVYGNLKQNWIARASAAQAYIFHGVVQRGGNGLGAPLLIGTNHLYRVSAFKEIGGYQDCITEDHFTSMAMIGAQRKGSDTNWKGVYTPDILAIGEGPTSFTDYFNQQQRWAYGIWEIIQRFSRNSLKTMSASQRLTFVMLQFFYPSLAISWVVSSMVSVGFSFIHPEYNGLGFAFTLAWLVSLASCLGIFFWSRRFNLSGHERNDWGVSGIVLTLMTLPVYTNAAWQAIRKVPLTYAVTAKGNMASPDSIRTFYPHIWWIAVSTLAALLIYAGTRTYMSSAFFWTVEHAVVCLLPMLVFAYFKTHRSIREMISTARYRTKES